jgi:hypothetical protein
MFEDGGYTGDQGATGTEGGNNPAWNEFLEVVPEELHHKVTPLLEKWDKGVQDRFEKVQSDYKPWQEFQKAGVEPDTTRFALNLLNSLNENPQMVYKAIGDYYKFSNAPAVQGSGQGQNEPDKPDLDPYDARFAEIERQNQLMAQVLVSQDEAKKAASADAQLDQELTGLRKKYGEFDEQYVLAKMGVGKMSAKDAVENYFNWRESEIKKYRPKPLIMGGNGGVVPGQHVDPKKMNESGVKDLVVQMLQATAEQRQQ